MILHASLGHLFEPVPGPFLRLDARVKLLLALWILLLVAWVPAGQLTTLGRLGGAVALLAFWARAPLHALLIRMVPLVPFLAMLVFIPFLHPGKPVWALGWLSPTDAGLSRALEVLLRMGTMGLLMALLTVTTSSAELLAALRALRVPSRLILTLELTLRYLFLLAEEAQRMHRAWRARGGSYSPSALQREGLGALLGALFLRAYARGERTWQAMQSRGYSEAEGSRTDGLETPLTWPFWQTLAVLGLGALFTAIWRWG